MTVRARKTKLVTANFSSLEHYTRFPYALLISQTETERTLEERLKELGVTVHRPYRVTDIAEADDGIRVSFESGEVIKARYVVGADGSRSTVRRSSSWDAVQTGVNDITR